MEQEVKDHGKEQEMPHYRTPMAERIDCLFGEGYTDEFMISEEGLLKSLDTGEEFKPSDIKIVEHQRFEGISDPDDMAILFIVETKNGLKGTIVDAFGVYGNQSLMEFMNQVKDYTIETVSKYPHNKCFEA